MSLSAVEQFHAHPHSGPEQQFGDTLNPAKTITGVGFILIIIHKLPLPQ
jgi:hypothetical protein